MGGGSDGCAVTVVVVGGGGSEGMHTCGSTSLVQVGSGGGQWCGDWERERLRVGCQSCIPP